MPAEKNDVDISALFNFGKKCELLFNGKSVTIYMRLVGDAELSRARVFAIRKSAELRAKLKDGVSDEAVALIPVTDDYDDELILESIITFSTQEITKKVINDMDFPYPNDLDSEATLEEEEKYQKEVDEYPSNRINKIKAQSMIELEKLRKELKTKSRAYLELQLKEKIIASHCEREMMKKFTEVCAYYGCFKDKNYKVRMFESFEMFENLLPEIKEQILDFYNELELDSETLKK